MLVFTFSAFSLTWITCFIALPLSPGRHAHARLLSNGKTPASVRALRRLTTHSLLLLRPARCVFPPSTPHHPTTTPSSPPHHASYCYYTIANGASDSSRTCAELQPFDPHFPHLLTSPPPHTYPAKSTSLRLTVSEVDIHLACLDP